VKTGFGLTAASRHFITAFLGNLRATRLLSAIAIFGLTIGLTGAILMALAARTALEFNGFLPDRERIHIGISVLSPPGMLPNFNEASNARAAALIKANVPEVEAVARLAEQDARLRRGDTISREKIYWADPDIFALLRFPALHGQPATALHRPDAIVMTRSAAVRLFGRDDALGEAIEVDGHPMILTAVIADVPPNMSDLSNGIFASGRAAQSALTQMESASGTDGFAIGARTYLRLRPDASPDRVERRIAKPIEGLLPGMLRNDYAMRLVRIDRLALHEGFHPGALQRLQAGSLVAALTLFIAIANFVNLSVGLSARRRREIGVRKASGASRGQIAVQFMGEAVAMVMIATLLAAAAVELVLPHVNAFLGTQASFDYVEHPALILWLILSATLLGLVVGAYPALLLSSLPTIAVLRDRGMAGQSRGLVRNALVTLQFAILIGLIIAVAVVYQQRIFAMHDGLRADIDGLVAVSAPCPKAFAQEVARLAGVQGVSCSGAELLDGDVFALIETRGRRISTDLVTMLPSNFALYGIAPIAGTLVGLPANGEETVSRIVINQAAVVWFGYPDPAAAVGQIIPVPGDVGSAYMLALVVAVVPDFAFYSVETAINPTIYLDRAHRPGAPGLVSIKLEDRERPATLAAIDRLWRATGHSAPIERAFVSDHIERLYDGLERNTRLFAIFAGVATFLACLGLVGLSVSVAEHRTKEIGIRKALGARTDQILTMLLFQLVRPVLWANLLAWPVAWWVMRGWLSGFAYHVELQLWLFPAAGLLALAFALASVGGQSFAVARQKPIHALRHE
jgi:putative ABC transport system permease protein